MAASACIVLEMRLRARIGVCERERGRAQPLELRVEVAVDSRRAASTDSLDDALDYAALRRRLDELVAAGEWHLIESLGEAICALVMGEFGAPWMRLHLAKPQALEGARVALVMERAVDAGAMACYDGAPSAAAQNKAHPAAHNHDKGGSQG